MSGALLLVVGIAAVGAYLTRGSGSPAAGTRGQAGSLDVTVAPRPSDPSAPIGSEEGETAPDFAVPTADEGVFRLSSYRGRVVVMDFLAPGCTSCTAEISTLTRTWDAFKDEGVVVLVVDIGGLSPQQAAEYYRGLGGGDLLYGEDRGFRVGQAYEVIDLSTTVVIDPRGVVTFRDSGFTSLGTLQAATRRSMA